MSSSSFHPFSGCGILGMLLLREKNIPDGLKSKFNFILDSLKHRGPNGSGVFSESNVMLGHRRLSILDTSTKGSQPMTRDHLTISLNGEIYNFQDIRKLLQNEGFTFTSNTDTEVVLRSYQKWGAGALNKFNGMFAFAIWNSSDKSLFIARDRLGKKPLYYFSDKNVFLFSSEVHALLKSGYIKPEADICAFENQLFATSFHITDLSQTLIRNVKSLRPGHTMNISYDGAIKIKKYWDLPENKYAIDETNANKITDELESLVEDSIKLRLISDVPVSSFLSGGVDSSLINYFVAKQTSEDITSITINYPNGGIDLYSGAKDQDLYYSKELVKSLKKGIKHEIVQLNSSELTIEKIDRIIDQASLPDDDRLLSIIKNYECVKNLGFKVVLNGQGADEIMGGYTALQFFYENVFDAQNYDNEIFENIFPAYTIPGKNILNKNSYPIADKVYKNIIEYYKTLSGDTAEKAHRFLTKTQLVRILQFEDYLSMQHSVECRLPFLDYRIVEFAFKIPFNLNFEPGTRTGKMLLRKIALKNLPKIIANRPKQAFPAFDTEQKYAQLYNLFLNYKVEILNTDLIRRYFNFNNNSDFKTLSISELWLIIVIWRWTKKVESIVAF